MEIFKGQIYKYQKDPNHGYQVCFSPKSCNCPLVKVTYINNKEDLIVVICLDCLRVFRFTIDAFLMQHKLEGNLVTIII